MIIVMGRPMVSLACNRTAIRAFVPTGDDTVEVFTDDGIVRGVDNRSQRNGGGIGVLPLGHVFDREENHLRRAVVPFQPAGR